MIRLGSATASKATFQQADRGIVRLPLLERGEQSGRDLRDEHQDDPTYLAFAYFGDPWTRLSFDPVLA